MHRIRSARQRPASNMQSSCSGSSVAACLPISPVSPNAAASAAPRIGTTHVTVMMQTDLLLAMVVSLLGAPMVEPA